MYRYLAMRFGRRRKRIYPFLVFFAAASCIFLAFQFFSFNILTGPQKPVPSGPAALHMARRTTTEKCGLDGCHAERRGDVFKMEHVIGHGTGKHYRLAKYTAKPRMVKPAVVGDDGAEPEHIDMKLDGQAFMAAHDHSQMPIGVPSESVNLYIPDSQHQFSCIHSKKKIDFSRVNDDYCDCSDSSDEPGTSACPDARFYCTVRVAVDTGKLWVPSSHVNDGVCDCCDGSDEWSNDTVMDNIKFKGSDQDHIEVYQTPCHNRCPAVVALQSGADRVRLQGLRAKKAYLAAGAKLNRYNAKRYGPAGAFYLLGDVCYKLDTSVYRYTVCPFRDVKQEKLADSSFHVLGRESSWLIEGADGQYQLKMAGGDSVQCPDSKSRSTIIDFVCDVKERVVSVKEDEVCTYRIKLATPAACDDCTQRRCLCFGWHLV